MIARSFLAQDDAEDVKIFYSYARLDETWRNEIDQLLPDFDWDVGVRTWYDGEIQPGEEWEAEIDKNLAVADIILLFITQAFVDSKFCKEVELPAALDRHYSGDARVIPIILEATSPDWKSLDLARLQVLPKNGIPVGLWQDRSVALREVVQGLINIVVRQGLQHDIYMRWKLHLGGNISDFGTDERHGATKELRTITKDETLRVVDVEPGSVVLTLESTQDALARTRYLYDEGNLNSIAGSEILKIAELFGAGIQTSSSIVEKKKNPDYSISTDRMLLTSAKFEPVLIKGITANEENPLSFESTVSRGDSGLEGEAFEAETYKQLDYIRTAISVPEDDLYVNLAPNENAKLLSESLRNTRLGRDLLEFDYRLKRLSASLLHPDLESGQLFWDEVTSRCNTELGLDNVSQGVYQRVWIAPDKAVVWESTREEFGRLLKNGFENYDSSKRQPAENETPSVFVVEMRLKAMTEREYFASEMGAKEDDHIGRIYDQAYRDIVLPIVEKEVNEGENFAELQQIYNGLVLATWFKKKYKTHPRVARYIDSNQPDRLEVKIFDVSPFSITEDELAENEKQVLDVETSQGNQRSKGDKAIERIRASDDYKFPENREYFERYLDIFEKGVFSITRDELVEGTGKKICRSYFAGGIDLRYLKNLLK